MKARGFALGVWLWFGAFSAAPAQPAGEALIDPAHRLTADAPAWRTLADDFRAQPDCVATFEERRFFPFRNEPIVLKGEVRVSRAHGLSLHYTAPEERTVVIDAHGMVIREPSGRNAAPPDPRANAANDALRHVLRLDFSALEKGYEVYGHAAGEAWSLALVPRDAAVRRGIGNIFVTGAGVAVQRIELRRSARQHIDIAMSDRISAGPFTAEEIARYFR